MKIRFSESFGGKDRDTVLLDRKLLRLNLARLSCNFIKFKLEDFVI